MNYDLEGMANHAKGLVANVRGNLRRSLESIGVVRPRLVSRPPLLPPSPRRPSSPSCAVCRIF